MTDTDAKKKRPWNLFGGGGRAHKKSPSSSQKVFGVDLDEVELDDELNIPIVCRDAIERLKETGKRHPPSCLFFSLVWRSGIIFVVVAIMNATIERLLLESLNLISSSM